MKSYPFQINPFMTHMKLRLKMTNSSVSCHTRAGGYPVFAPRNFLRSKGLDTRLRGYDTGISTNSIWDNPQSQHLKT